MGSITLESVRKAFPNGVEALPGLDLSVADGEFLVLVGASGCGKTTTLRLVAGLDTPTSGRILMDGREIQDTSPGDRDVAMVFQNYALYPHMSVHANIAFALRARGVGRDERDRRVREIAQTLDIEPLLGRKPRMLSGGQRQRVAMGRAIVRQPQAFLMDEPLSNLDARLRVQMRGDIVHLQKELGTTTIYVTHDQSEAMTMGDRVALMSDGDVQQIATPQALYDMPANTVVARFIGSPPMNLLEGELVTTADGLGCALGNASLPLDDRVIATWRGLHQRAGQKVIVGIRPEGLSLIAPGPGSEGLPGIVYLSVALGSETLVHVDVAVRGAPQQLRTGGAPTGVAAAPEGQCRVSARVPKGVQSGGGDRVLLHITPEELAFFDPETGEALDRNPASNAGRLVSH